MPRPKCCRIRISRFQTLVIATMAFTSLVDGFYGLDAVFLLFIPKYRCSLPGYENDTSIFEAHPPSEMGNSTLPTEQCAIGGENGTEVTCSAWVYDESVMTSSAVMEFDIVCDRTILRSTANLAFMVGMSVGAITGGAVSDRFGRRVAWLIGVGVQSLGAIGNGLAPDIYTFCACRSLLGFGNMVAYGSAFVLCTELVEPKVRQIVGTGVNLFFTTGVMVMALFAYCIRHWRHLLYALASVHVLFISYWWLVPESPRWLINQGRRTEAEELMRKIAKINKKESPMAIISDEDKLGSGQKETLLQLLRHRVCCLRLIIMIVNWIAITSAFYGLSLNSGNLSGDVFINYFVIALIEVPAYIFALFAPMRFGRKASHAFCMILGGAACIASIFVVMFADESYNWLLTVLSTIGKFGASSAFASVYIYTAELQPTSLRTTGLGICSMSGRVGGMLAPYVSDMGQLIHGPFSSALPLVTFGSISITAGLLSLLLPETYAKQLPETIREAAAFGRNKNRKNSSKTPVTSEAEVPLSQFNADR